MDSLRGRLLISSARLFDENFRQTVVLLAEHSGVGAAGVVLNRPMEVAVADAVPGLARLVPAGEMLFQGGPVEPDSAVLLVELDRAELLGLPAFGAVGFIVGELSEELEASVLRARVYVGYSGWGPGQLEAEIASGAWILDPARAEDVFTQDPERLWRRVLARMGPEYERMSRVPFDPTMN
jgi:putative transcriptional regulator